MAVLPFRVHAADPVPYGRLDLQKILSADLARFGFGMADPELVRQRAANRPSVQEEGLYRTGRELSVDWVVSGSLTEVGKKISVDVTLVNVSGERPPHLLYMVVDDLDALSDAMDRVAVGIDNQITGSVQVDAVRVAGNQRVEKEAVLAVVRTKKGDRLDYDRLDKDLRDVYKMRYFKDVKIETEDGPNGKIVTFRVTEKPSIGKIDFEGNKEVSGDDLKKEIGIKPYSILDPSEIRQSINRLRDFYRQKGYYNVEIEDRVEPLPNNEVQLKYVVDEHEKVYIKKIEFLGNAKFDDGELKGIMETGERGFFSWLTDSGYLDKKKLEYDVYKLTSFYHNHGYINALVGEPKVSYQKEKGLTITIEVQEGHQFGPGKVSVDGDLIEPKEELLKLVHIGDDKVFSRETVRKDILALKDAYADEGYAYAEVTPRTKEDDAKHLVDIAYVIDKGKKVRFGRITITGNSITRDKVIRRELKAVEGEYFSAKALERSTQNLNRLGFFEDVEIQTKKAEEEELMNLNIRVKERPTGSLSFGAGYSSVDALVGMLQISQDNLFGYGQRLAAAIRLGGKSSQFDVRYTEPWLFDRPISADVQAYKWKREFDDYTKDSLGGALTIGFPISQIDEFTRGSVTYNYDDADITDVSPYAALVIRDMEGRNVTSSMTFGLTRNSTDRAWNTSRGSVNSLTVEYAGGILGGDNYFNKYTGRSAWYFPLPWETVFMLQGRWGYIQERSGGRLPVYEKFFLGGINTVRGFEYASISPRDPATGDKIGGEKMMVYNVEYRFPLLKDQGLMGVVFFDAGNVFTADQNYTFSGIRMGAGGGVRWYSPMGPLRLEWGYNLDPQYDEPSSQFEFSIGTQW